MAMQSIVMNFFPYVFALLLILPLPIFLVFRKPKNGGSNMKLPPGSCGWPVFGESFKYVSIGTQQFIGEKRRKYLTDVFQTSLFGQKMAVFCGAQGNKFAFTKLVTSWWPVTVKKTLFSPEFSHMPVDEASAAMHRFVHEILKPEALKNYVPVMDAMAREHVESKWDGNDVVKVHPLSKEYTFNLAYRLFVNVLDDVEHVRRIFKHFALVTSGMFSVPINLPGTAYNRGIKGGKIIREEIVKIITKRRQEMEKKESTLPSTDCLSRMLLVTDENGKFMSAKEMSNYIIGLLIGSYESTSTAVSFVLKYLAELPHIYDKVYKELMEIAKSKGEGELLKWEDIQKMRYSWNVVCETLRVTPPVQGGFRELVTDVSFSGFTIPKGYKASWTAYTTHKDPEYFPDPEKFDPSRFEGNGPAPYTFVPFGGGPRVCCGREYARLEVLVFIYNIVTKFKLEIINPQEKIVFHSFPIPMEGLPLRIIGHNA
ncbi:Beta-amyrin 28-oxidase [Heracleum sosnowskyi]|uniref:Beta-amyrin 28-oxidase n=1 Tax=Heracleum sosnowskyi TaxID=360622 RepID=A0AAD8HR54_9APIA|nr:Beta-amyrin 28-oxidase [Heracleum sosnowskyi]